MKGLTHDADADATSLARTGLGLALISAASFGISGALAQPLLSSGWSAGAVVLARVGIGALAVMPLALTGLRGQWNLLRRNIFLIARFGLIAVVVTQFCFFSALQYLQVGTALLIEFTAPAVVVVWMWLRHGQRPGPVTLAGAAVAAVGLVLVLQLLTGAHLSLPGVLWALAAMIGVVGYFVMSADGDNGLPPLTLAAGGLTVAAVLLGGLGLAGLLPMRAGTTSVAYAGSPMPALAALALLGLVTAALSYSAGIGASRRLGSRLASFVALSELLFGVLWAWTLLDQVPRPIQILGGVLILGGVATVKLGERSIPSPEPVPTG